jgi:hypothetical protein
MAPPELESSADDYLSSHDESSGLKLLFVQPGSFRGSRKLSPIVDSLTRPTKLIK